MKLSFSLPSKQSSKPPLKSSSSANGFAADDNSTSATTNHDYVTEFDASKTQPTESNERRIIIPPKENEWRPRKKMKNLDLPSLHSSADPNELRFEVDSSAAPADQDPASQISFGLNLRQSSKDDDAADRDFARLQNNESIDNIMLKKLREDLSRLPDDEGFENQFEEVPVEGFGKALLAGYGWTEGRGIGKRAKEDVAVVEYKRRTAKEGLGFLSDGDPNKRSEKPDKKAVNLGFSAGKEVRIIGSRDAGSKGRVLEVLQDGNLMRVKLSHSKETVTVKINDVVELGSAEEEKFLKKFKEMKILASKDDSRRREEGKRNIEERKRGGPDEFKQERGRREESRSRVSWLRSHIRVRIISKELKRGRLYLKKGEVVDVVGPTTCDVSMDDSKELIQGVDQDVLETALPRRGGPVLVLLGRHKGAYGNLVEKDSERETGVVQDADTRELLNVRLEEIAEYVGDPSYIGY